MTAQHTCTFAHTSTHTYLSTGGVNELLTKWETKWECIMGVGKGRKSKCGAGNDWFVFPIFPIFL